MIVYSTIRGDARTEYTQSPVIVDLEGSETEVLYIRALGKDLGIKVCLDDSKTGVVISVRDGMYRQEIEEAEQGEGT